MKPDFEKRGVRRKQTLRHARYDGAKGGFFDNLPFLLSDTVGFIRKLPTELIESFKSTLDEVREADLLLHVVDISHPQFEDQIAVVKQTLQDIGAGDKPVYLVFNKVDAYTYVEKEPDDLTPSTRENRSLEDLKQSWIARAIRPASLFRRSRRSISRSCVRICTAWSVKSIRAAIHSTTSSIDLKQKVKIKYNLMLHILNSQNTVLNKFVAEIRDKSIQKDSMRFRRNLERIGEVVAYEISKTFEYAVKVVENSAGRGFGSDDLRPGLIATILRAGLPFHQGFLELLRRRAERFRFGLSQEYQGRQVYRQGRIHLVWRAGGQDFAAG